MSETNNKIPFSSIRRAIRKKLQVNTHLLLTEKDPASVGFVPCDLKMWVGNDSDFFRRAFCHHRMILKVILSGRASTRIDGIRYDFSPGEAVLYFPMQTHSTETEDCSEFEYLAVTFVVALGHYEALHVLKNQVFRLRDEEMIILSELVKAYQEGRSLHSTCLLTELLAELVQRFSRLEDRMVPGDAHRFGQITSYIRDHCRETLSVKQIADHFHISEQTVQRIFHADLPGVTPGLLIRKQRMIRAQELLRRTDLSLEEIASACGFSSPYSFSRAFRREYRTPPSFYRKHRRNRNAEDKNNP